MPTSFLMRPSSKTLFRLGVCRLHIDSKIARTRRAGASVRS